MTLSQTRLEGCKARRKRFATPYHLPSHFSNNQYSSAILVFTGIAHTIATAEHRTSCHQYFESIFFMAISFSAENKMAHANILIIHNVLSAGHPQDTTQHIYSVQQWQELARWLIVNGSYTAIRCKVFFILVFFILCVCFFHLPHFFSSLLWFLWSPFEEHLQAQLSCSVLGIFTQLYYILSQFELYSRASQGCCWLLSPWHAHLILPLQATIQTHENQT